ncbi:glycosyltransferase family 2 protein [Nostoc sp. FACHB-152]|uniref:hormogonium polysaccharide biosynthesis glycosyltransferase HpsE n=1 Tax=unclassified Nostoc TaxID=2593658 RepID=UPI0016844A17|nr:MULTISPECIES: hormogonium polysaccharide biosynthesis glycosyltransferase HpsE [unclassified Nostoc]MBD2448462.1 glycosyltransferase family 2 protein [Nostoc sp. FACHB-152]MBD2466199.1 glycosyltransferase family 2 protein [Nostoc sp. FACHB-145]
MAEAENYNFNISVVIPTYNGAERLPKVLDSLLEQLGTANIRCEINIIDNNSYDRTFDVVQSYHKKFPSDYPIRYFLEKQQGITFARMRGVNESRGEFIAFLDDDNIPTPDWLLQSYTFGKEHPHAGAWSGQIHGNFEINPPENFSRIQAFLAIREHGEQAYLFDAANLRLPPGAALVVRQTAWLESVPQDPRQLVFKGRLGKLMIGGDDTEILLYLHRRGWQIWYNPAMHIYHQIPCWRFERDYLLNLARGYGLCIFQLRLINAKSWQRPVIFCKTILGNFRRIIQHLIKYNFYLKSDLIALFEIKFYFASMVSPFYALKWFLLNKFNFTGIHNKI